MGGREGPELVSPSVLCIEPGSPWLPAQLPHVLLASKHWPHYTRGQSHGVQRLGWAGQVGGAGCGVTCVQCGRGVMWPVAWRCWSQAAGGRAQEAAVGGTRPSTTTSLTSTIDQCGAEVRLGRTEQLIHHTVNRQPGRAPVLPLNMPIVNTHSSVIKHVSGSE